MQINAQLCVFLLFVFLNTTDAEADDDPVVSLRNGSLRGEYVMVKGTDQLVQKYLGIPYALPPTGPLRLAAPKPPFAWEGVKDATRQPPMCLQNLHILAELSKAIGINASVPSEDCLYLNVYTPSNRSADNRLPVMVWIHGGGLILGGASHYDGSALAAYQSVVVVVIQYRLGLLGLLSTGDEHAKGNWAFLDQIAALRWVQENIENFGGDPKCVTIFGESAGGISTSLLMLSPLATGLFHRVIAQSGVAMVHGFATNDSLHQTKMMAESMSCEHNSTEHLIQCMRQKTEDDFVQGVQSVKIMGSTVDGYFLEKPVEELFKNKEFSKVPILLGVTNDEFGWLIPKSHAPAGWEKGMDKQTVMHIMDIFHPSRVAGENELILAEYLRDAETPEQIRDAFTEMMGDLFIVHPTITVSRYHKDAGAPVYFYEFQHAPVMHRGRRPSFVKADHADDVGFVFGVPFWTRSIGIRGLFFTKEEAELSKSIMAYWANFARSGSPNGPGLTEWPAYGESEEYLNLDLNQTVGQKLKDQKMHFLTVTLPEKLSISNTESKKL